MPRESETLAAESPNDTMVRRVPLEALQGIYEVSAKEGRLLSLLPNKQKSSVDGINFGRIRAIKG
jgi:hypothetical protein